jgi:hypothetical protein
VTSRNGRERFDGRVELEDTGLGSACYTVRDVIRFGKRARVSLSLDVKRYSWRGHDIMAPSTK